MTCGIYGIIWLVQMVDELNAAAGETNATSGIMVFLLSLVTCNIYSWYWFYKAGELVNRASGTRGGAQDQNRGICLRTSTNMGCPPSIPKARATSSTTL